MKSDYNQEMSFSDDCLRAVNLGNKIIEKQLSSGSYKHVSCNVCGSDDPIVFAVDYQGELHKRRVKCKKCGLVYSDPQATKSNLKNYYETYNNSVKTIEEIIQLHESLVSQYNRIFSTLTNKSKGGRFLDIGCSTGHFINEGRRYGWDVFGIEISPGYVEYAREKFGLSNVRCTDLFNAKYPDNFFDYVWLWHVLEHVSDAKGLLTEINRIMKPGAELRIGVPCVKDPIYLHLKWRGSKIKGFSSDQAHTYEFSPKVLKKMAERANFHVTRVETYYNPGALKKFLTYRSSWKAKKIISFLYYLSHIVPNWFGHRVAVHCIKKK